MARPSNLSKLSIEHLHAEIQRRQQSVAPLQRRREKLLAQVAEIDAQIASVSGAALKSTPTTAGKPRASGRRRRAVNKVSLPEALHAAMKGKRLSIAEAAEAVTASGYKTFSRNFKGMVSVMLANTPKLFKRVARGQYAAR